MPIATQRFLPDNGTLAAGVREVAGLTQGGVVGYVNLDPEGITNDVEYEADDLPADAAEEIFTCLLEAKGFRLERIISAGQATPLGEWYDQDDHEWVVLLRGSAGLRFQGESQVHVLNPGDYLEIPAHRRHRVEWTDGREKTVWLALHFKDSR